MRTNSGTTRALTVLLVLFALLASSVVNAPVAFAAKACIDYRKMGPTWMEIRVTCPETDLVKSSSFIQARSKSRTIANGPKLRYSVKYFSECTPDLTTIRSCDAIADPTCPNGGYRTIRTITAVNGPRQGAVVSTTQYCQVEPPSTIPGAADDIAKVTLADFRRLPILGSKIISQPKNFSLRNGNAHLYANSRSQDFHITLFDQDVRVRAIPISYLWSYGDGASRTLNFPGTPEPDHSFDETTSTSHIYKETGDFGVGLSTRYRGEYSTEGGPWTPIPGVANVPSTPITMSVWRTKKVLVADDCETNPSGPGCASIFE